MSAKTPALAEVAEAAAAYGLILRGGFHPGSDEAPSDRSGSRPVRTIVLLGNAGPGMWRTFTDSPEAGDGVPDGLDRWTRRVVSELAERFEAMALYPFGGPPYHPFQRWAMRSEPVAVSPLGILIHPEYGLWHGYRAALAFAQALKLPPREEARSPCESCAERPCLSACPVDAFSGEGYDVAACAAYLASPDGMDCMEESCRARRACPVGREYLYERPQAAWHMRAFLGSRGT